MKRISASVSPEGKLEVLSQLEVRTLLDTSARGLYRLFRNCALAVLNSGSHTDDAREIFEREYLTAQINRFGGNISRTAEFIGMERSALHRKLKSLGIG